MTNVAHVTAAVSEFLNLWACGGSATLKLDTTNGGCTVNFTAHLGHPGAPLQASPPSTSPHFKHIPSPPASGQRYRGPADKQRSRERAAARQAAAEVAPLVTPAPATPAPATAEAAAQTAPLLTDLNVPPFSPATPAKPAETLAANAAKELNARTEPTGTAGTECDPEVASTSCKA